MGLTELSLIFRIVVSLLAIIGVVGGVVWAVRKNKYDFEQLSKDVTRHKNELDTENDRLARRLDRHEERIHETERQNSAVAQHLQGLENSIKEVKDILLKLIPTG